MNNDKSAIPLPQLVYKRVKKIHAELQKSIYSQRTPLEVGIGPLHEVFVSAAIAEKEIYTPIISGEVFSPQFEGPHKEFPWKQRWFKIELPAAKAEEKGRRYLEWQAHGESTIYIHGQPWAGLDCAHPDSPVPDEACTLLLDCGLWQTGIWGGYAPPDHHGFKFEHARLSLRDDLAWKVFHDIDVLKMLLETWLTKEGFKPKIGFGYAEPLYKINPLLRRLLSRMTRACDAYDRNGLGEFSKALDKIYVEFKTDPLLGEVSYVGHAHIDLVWLWPERATYKKGIHTFSTQLRLMEKYPDYTFTMSQPPLYYHIKEHEPVQAEAIQARIKEGRWEFTGGLEVEADTQIPVGEGLARSIIYGQERIEAVRGEKSTTVWIPDVFGYSQCLPQLFALAGINNFYTTKILWTEISRFPHNSFVWKSPDGSEVLTHLAVAGYNCEVRPAETSNGIEVHQQSDVHHELLCAAGYGDGGGGATEGHCERAIRMADLSGLPKSKWSTVESFFDRLEAVRDELPSYRGELYLEYHRGVQTSQSDFKFNLRTAEKALQLREAVRVITGQSALLAKDWLRYLFMHFHDAIPGSSINTVYAELNPELVQIAETHRHEAEIEWGVGASKGWTVINPLALSRFCAVVLPAIGENEKLVDAGGHDILHQAIEGGVKTLALLQLSGLGSRGVMKADGASALNEKSVMASSHHLDNGILCAKFDDRGQLISCVIDGESLALVKPAGFWLHIDQPEDFDAWDIDHPATWLGSPTAQDLNLEVLETGSVRSVLRGQSKIGLNSQLQVDYILYAESRTLQIECRVDWHEYHQWLKYKIDTDYRGSMARYGAPFGSVDRPQTIGLPEQEAQWEVPASRWASVMDGRGKGLSLITEAKYGFSAKEGAMSLSLLRSPTSPDPVCDRGRHTIKFSIGAHKDEICGNSLSTAAHADALYTDAIVLEGQSVRTSPFALSQLGSVVPAWVMPSRDGQGDLIRLHEVAGSANEIQLEVCKGHGKVCIVDLNEKELRVISPSSVGPYRIAVGAYKILTIKIYR
jgi:alpha-mannosidase